MTVYQAIDRMRELSKSGEDFSFSFMSYNRTQQTTEGIVEVRHARLRKRSKSVDYARSEMLEPYLDLDTNEPRKFYHPTLMTFNGQRLSLT